MNGIVYVFHGSQKEEKNKAAMDFVQQLKNRLNEVALQEAAFLENHPWTIQRQIEQLIEKGADRIVIVPVLLFAARHALVDIPMETKKVQKKYPGIDIEQTETFGDKEGSRQILLERFIQARAECKPKDTAGVLLAHGTKRTEEPQKMLEEIAGELQEKTELPVTAMSLKGQEDYIEQIYGLLQKYSQLIIVPFFLFDGHLIHLLKERLTKEFPNHTFIITPTLEFDHRILDDLEKIVREALYVPNND
ncbi:sirohydrochlorin chelatase [Enterococcus sp. BWT-B8]|uniref:sirohydrochlorin chelatase n=1 Tax=Enterococcus sp. BWT-B8 TaxID=2885157 RepID=UPI001E54D857|nr:CbiX/SirB N-terminal domain-containing protein [Enterococcus sp. BWT-B8]MCB5951608.1 sirohydrochlorin chelatase [Enterococcus sp. BWT-B8]